MLNLIPQAHAAIDIESNFHMGETGSLAGKNLASFISPLIQDVFVLAGIILVILLIFGGVTYIINAGSGDKEGMEKGSNALTSALLGFVIIFVAYWLVQIIQYITGVDIFNSKF